MLYSMETLPVVSVFDQVLGDYSSSVSNDNFYLAHNMTPLELILVNKSPAFVSGRVLNHLPGKYTILGCLEVSKRVPNPVKKSIQDIYNSNLQSQHCKDLVNSAIGL